MPEYQYCILNINISIAVYVTVIDRFGRIDVFYPDFVHPAGVLIPVYGSILLVGPLKDIVAITWNGIGNGRPADLAAYLLHHAAVYIEFEEIIIAFAADQPVKPELVACAECYGIHRNRGLTACVLLIGALACNPIAYHIDLPSIASAAVKVEVKAGCIQRLIKRGIIINDDGCGCCKHFIGPLVGRCRRYGNSTLGNAGNGCLGESAADRCDVLVGGSPSHGEVVCVNGSSSDI